MALGGITQITSNQPQIQQLLTLVTADQSLSPAPEITQIIEIVQVSHVL